MKIVKNLVPAEKYSIKCPFTMIPEFIVVHNTANDATARDEIDYMIDNNNKTSYHYAIDDKEIVQGLLENRNGWHAGDGRDGEGNRKGIGIEICYSECGGDRFIAAEKLAAEFIASKLKEKGWGIEKVKKHQDFDGKYCPHRTLDMGWQRFLNMINGYMVAKPTAQNNVWYRVQVGAFSEKPYADAHLAKVKAAGFNTYMVKLDGMYKIQVGAFREKPNANACLAELKAAGFSAFITTRSGEAVTATKKTVEQIAKEVIQGKWGNGEARKQKLKAAGYTDAEIKQIQAKVNVLC